MSNNNLKLFAVGIGPGNHSLFTHNALEVIDKSTTIVGYNSYIKKMKDLVDNKNVISNGMRKESERCQAALDEALKGEIVSVISSGDAGVYGMAGLLIEMTNDIEKYKDIEIEVVPGITAACAAAAVLGAPLMNDFVIFSLSDCLTPKKDIQKRIKDLAPTDLPCVIYNPKSTKRIELFKELINEFCTVRSSKLVCGFVKHCSMDNQETWIGTIDKLPIDEVDMSTIVFFGNSKTMHKNGKMFVTRGYSF